MKTLFITIVYLLAFTILHIQSTPTAYGVSYELMGKTGYSVVYGSPVEIIDELNSRQINIIDIRPIR
jgi:hypothetical protein